MSALNDKLLATSQGEELIETLRSLPYDDLLHIIPLLQHLHAHIESAPGQYAAARAGNFLKLVKSARLPSSILSETLYACRSADPVKPVKDSSNYTSTKTYRLDHIAFTEPNWPIDEFRRSFAQWEEESGHLMSYEQLRNKGAVLEGDVNIISRRSSAIRNEHILVTEANIRSWAPTTMRLITQFYFMKMKVYPMSQPARAILLWEDKIFGSLQNFYITSRRPVPYFVRMDPYVHGELCKIEAQFRKSRFPMLFIVTAGLSPERFGMNMNGDSARQGARRTS
ncbi:hypothetical protein PUNSTDRAFT_47549 [Punctularia strigosozonata HHB-11173 SS5]|uniref:Uncharacterized protein n=1 Tax=Punctularia strigosozonata (strain HHB-11173) TaxID=741275 RepID=R7S1M4_PUNST|nr:uncharacterized protein PUNSTDRAFT_47549 [Punctularia strigosozonata HHB-11173 SS5]EIN04275.1 hypothetical protein PUNSTDRAFT_47549 [Punctularia strigosozonata HHB-11173 SS5]